MMKKRNRFHTLVGMAVGLTCLSSVAHATVSLAQPNHANQPVSELVIIDHSVSQQSMFTQGLGEHTTVAYIYPNTDGVRQLESILSSYHDLDAVHLVSHGSDGTLYLGNSELTEAQLQSSTIMAINSAIKPKGDLLLYGCNVAQSEKGQRLLALLAENAGIDVAASNDLTGNSQLGGDWQLEQTIGDITTFPRLSAKAKHQFTSTLSQQNFSNYSGADSTEMSSSDFTIHGTAGGTSRTLKSVGGIIYMLKSVAADGTSDGTFTITTRGASYPSFDLSQVKLSDFNYDMDYASIYLKGTTSGGITLTSTSLTTSAGNEQNTYLFGTSSAGFPANCNNDGSSPNLTATRCLLLDSSWRDITEFKVHFQGGDFDNDTNNTTFDGLDFNHFTVGAAIPSDNTPPSITGVSIGNQAHKVGDTVTITINVDADSDNYTTGGLSGTINGYALGSLSKVNDTTYSASFTVTNGGTDVAAGSAIATNFSLTDSSGNTSSSYTVGINQANDAIYANLPEVNLTSNSNSINEDGGVVTLTATLSGSLNNQWPTAITANLGYSGTATAGTDYVKSDSIVIAIGSSSNTASLTGTADSLFDAASNETVIVDISSVSVGSEGSTNQQTITIIDAEVAPTVSLSTSTNTILEAGGSSNITATLSHPTYANVSVNLGYSGTATSGGTDYNTPSSSVVISAGSTTANAGTGITAVDDSDIENDETIIIDITSVTGGSATESGVQQRSVTITDDEDGTAPTISAVSMTNSAHVVGDTVSVTIIVTSDVDDYTTGSGGISGTLNGYVLGNLSKVNDTTYNATFTITDGGTDVAAGSTVATNFSLTDSSGNTSSSYTVGINQANDAIYANLPEVNLTSNSNSINEDGGVVTLTATLSGSLNNQWPTAITANLGYSGTATAGTDYVKSDSIVIAIGSSSNTASLTGTADSLFDAASNETVIVDISSVSVGSEGSTNQQTITIIDAEVAPTVSLSTSTNTILEAGGSSNITATLSHPTYANVSVNLGYSGTATSGGTDYNTPSSSVVISAGSTTANAGTGITAVDDSDIENDETIIIDITSVTGGSATESGVQQRSVTITDDEDGTAPIFDAAPSISNITHVGADLAVVLNEEGSVYYIIVTSGDSKPTAAQAKAGVAYSGATIHAVGSLNTSSGVAGATINALADGEGYDIYVVAQDNAGNLQANAAVAKLSLTTIDTEPNVNAITVVGSPADTATSIDFNVVFADDVANVSIDDFTANLISGSANVAPAVGGVSGSGSSYIVSVNTGLTIGDVRLDLNDSTNIIDENNNVPIAYSSGATHTVDTNNLPTITEATNSVGPFTIDEDIKTALDLTDLVIADSNNDSLIITISVDNGLIFATDGNGTVASTTIAGASASGSASITLSGLSADLTAFLDGSERIQFQTDEHDITPANVSISADDGLETSTAFTEVISINPINDAPTISGTPLTSIVDGNGYSFPPVADDVDSDTPLTFSIINQPTWANFDTATGELSGTPLPVHAGITSGIVIRVEDPSADGNDLAAFDIEVIASNVAPQITEGNSVTVNISEDETPTPFALTLNATDADNNSLTWAVTTNATQGLASVSGTGNSKVVSYTPTADYHGNDSFIVQVNDGLLTDFITVNVVIASINDLPSFTSSSVTALSEDSVYSYDISVSDSDDTSLIISATSKPSWLTLVDNGNGIATLSGTPTNDDTGNNSITLRVSDDENGIDTQSFVLVVSNTNDAPVITGSPLTTVAEDALYSFTPTVTDVDDGDTQSFSISSAPSWATFNPATGSLIGTPTNEDIGTTSNIVITVKDMANATASLAAFNLTVSNTNDAPVITGSPATTVAEDEAYSFTPTITDADVDDTHTFSISNKPSWLDFNTATGALTGTPTNDDVGMTNGIVITVKDAANAAASLTAFNLTVGNTNDAPVISGTPSMTVAEDEEYSFTPTVTDADVDDTHTFSISHMPSWAMFDTTTGALTGTPSKTDSGEYAGVSITVTDSESASASLAAFTITVSNTNELPIVQADSLSLDEDDSASITLVGEDSDGDTLSFSVVAEPANGSLVRANADNGQWVYTPDENYHGSDSFTYVASDSEGDSQAAVFSITVSPINDAPIAVNDNISLPFDESGQYLLNVLSNDTDVDEDVLTIISSSTDIGEVSIDNDQLVYKASNNMQGVVQLHYVIDDGNDSNGIEGQSSTAQGVVNLVITGDANNDLPVITVPEDIDTYATGLFTKVDLGVATALDSFGQQVPVSLRDATAMFEPGEHLVHWQATDANGLQSIATQKVVVQPIISVAKDETSIEGNVHRIGVYLNGDSPIYPVTVPYTVSGTADETDHDLVAGELVIEHGRAGFIEFSIVEDDQSEADETVIVDLSETVNKGSKSTYQLTISEKNIAPQISVNVEQNSERRLLIVSNAEEVVITALVDDANVADQHSFAWDDSMTDLADIDSDEGSYTFDTTALSTGLKKLTLHVTDDAVEPLTSTIDIHLKVVASLPTLTEEDSDGDLVPDTQEGYGDSDLDGIPDYLDAISSCNVMSEQLEDGQTFLAEGDAGVCLRIGSTVVQSASGGLELLAGELPSDDEASNIGGIFDFIAYGLPEAGQSFNLVLPQRLPIPESAVYRKYKPNIGWVEFVSDSNNYVSSTSGERGFCPPPADSSWEKGLTAGHWCVQVTIEDGGTNDDDGMANNTIIDPSGVAVFDSGNTLPVAEPEQVQMPWNRSLMIDVLSNDSDADGDSLTLLTANVDFGEVSIVDEQLFYAPETNFFGIATIQYGVNDGNGGTAYAAVTVNVQENRAPVAVNDSAKTDDRSAITIDVLVNDTDYENDTLTIVSASAEQGSVVIIDNQLVYTPLAGFDGVDLIDYTIDDGEHLDHSGQAIGQVSVTVTAYETITITITNTATGKSGGSFGFGALMFTSMLLLFRRRNLLGKSVTILWLQQRCSTAKVSKLFGLILLMFASFNSHANWQLKAELGQSRADGSHTLSSVLPELSGGELVNIDKKDTSWSLGVGYGFFDNKLTLSANYIDMGEGSVVIEADTLDAKQYHQSVATISPSLVTGYSLEADYQFDLGRGITTSLLLGGLSWEDSISSRDGDNTITTNRDGVDVYYGIKLNIPIQTHWQISAGFKRYNLPTNDVDIMSVGLTFIF